MTTTAKAPPSPALSHSNIEGQFALQRMSNTSSIPYNFHSLGLDFESPCLSSGQQSYFAPSTPASQEHQLGQSSYFPPGQPPYSAPDYRDLARYRGEYQSNVCTFPYLPIRLVLIASHIGTNYTHVRYLRTHRHGLFGE